MIAFTKKEKELIQAMLQQGNFPGAVMRELVAIDDKIIADNELEAREKDLNKKDADNG